MARRHRASTIRRILGFSPPRRHAESKYVYIRARRGTNTSSLELRETRRNFYHHHLSSWPLSFRETRECRRVKCSLATDACKVHSVCKVRRIFRIFAVECVVFLMRARARASREEEEETLSLRSFLTLWKVEAGERES